MTVGPDRGQLVAVLEDARRLGFVGPRPVAEQIDHATAFAILLETRGLGPARFLDLGSGGGIPGLVLAARWIDQRVTLLEVSVRRCAFLRQTVIALGWEERVEVAEGRAELLGRRPELRGAYPLVVSRSFAAPAVTAEIGGSFVGVGGTLAVSEPADSVDSAGRWPEDRVRELGFAPAEVLRGEFARVAILCRTAPLDERWPRAVGIPTKRPLW
jgi:16S rRNA (guanine527-N7)-methyltransferase